ncbi:hypothetical protein [Arthrobacter wenxiniae]|uniref:hypothetical protein n=1 Tax=Arthrobacter wenxiniae TaxID=2713570 RepID=UPI003CCCF19B
MVCDFVKADLMDQLHVAITPILLGPGIRLWDVLEAMPKRHPPRKKLPKLLDERHRDTSHNVVTQDPGPRRMTARMRRSKSATCRAVSRAAESGSQTAMHLSNSMGWAICSEADRSFGSTTLQIRVARLSHRIRKSSRCRLPVAS